MKIVRRNLPLPLEFELETKTFTLGENELSVEDWLTVRREMDLIVARTVGPESWQELREKLAWVGKADRLPLELREYEKDSRLTEQGFISNNWETLSQIKSGIIKRPPQELADYHYVAVIAEDEEDLFGDRT